MESVRPVNPVAGYVGGKKQLARHVIGRIGEMEHTIYAEPFVGMGGVFLRRPTRPKSEAINDASRDVATFFRILQRHYQAFLDMLKWQVTSRAEFQRLAAQDADTLTDLERAARFLYLQRLSFGGKVASRSFGIDTNGPARFDITRLVPLLEAVHERLAGVWVECLPWQEFIRRWDRPGTLFYLDPPYWGTEHYYGRGLFSRDEFQQLCSALQGLQGRFILSLNDVPEVRELFAWASIETVDLSYQAGGAGYTKRVREVVISARGKAMDRSIGNGRTHRVEQEPNRARIEIEEPFGRGRWMVNLEATRTQETVEVRIIDRLLVVFTPQEARDFAEALARVAGPPQA